VLLALLAAAVIFGPAVAAAAQLLVIVAAVLGGLAVVGVVAAAAARSRRWRVGGSSRMPLPGPAVSEAVQHAQAPWRAIEQPRPQLHLHFHGVNAEDVAAIITEQQQDRSG
jgi:hypothetical protein